MSFIGNLVRATGDFIYTYILIALFVAVGLYFSFKTKFVQCRLIGDAVKNLSERPDGNKVSSFQALMISTASRVGVGNIVGVTGAIFFGGEGALLWMWVLALIGSVSAFVESTLAQIYKVKENREFCGGPAYYIQKALKCRWLGIVFATLLIACFAYGLNAMQANTISKSMNYFISDYDNSIYEIIVALVITALTAYIIFGGVHRIGFISSYIVPVMAIVYIAVGLFIIIKNVGMAGQILSNVFSKAFSFNAASGGFIGAAILWGAKSGLLSNEAGMGSSPNVAATADVSHPVKQGMIQVISVFINTFFICTTTAFIVLFSGTKLEGDNMLAIVKKAIDSQVGSWGTYFLVFAIFTFSFTSIIGNYCYAESNMCFIKDNKKILFFFRLTCLVSVFLGCVADINLVWDLAYLLMAPMAILNIVAILLLCKVAFKALADYEEQKKSGKNPVFSAKKLGIENAEVWDEAL